MNKLVNEKICVVTTELTQVRPPMDVIPRVKTTLIYMLHTDQPAVVAVLQKLCKSQG